MRVISQIPEENAVSDPDHPLESSGTAELSTGSSGGDRKLPITDDAISLALADAITKAVAAGRFDVLPALVAELAARRT